MAPLKKRHESTKHFVEERSSISSSPGQDNASESVVSVQAGEIMDPMGLSDIVHENDIPVRPAIKTTGSDVKENEKRSIEDEVIRRSKTEKNGSGDETSLSTNAKSVKKLTQKESQKREGILLRNRVS